MDTSLKLSLSANPGYIATKVMKAGLYDAFVDGLLEVADELQQGSPVGATGELKAGWDVQYPRRETVTFTVVGKIVNHAPVAHHRIVGRGAGLFPPLAPLQDWVEAKIEPDPKKAKRIAYAIGKTIAKKGTKRHQDKSNWAGLNIDGSFADGGLLASAESKIVEKLKKIKGVK